MSEDRKPLIKVGALWKRVSRNAGYVYLSGEITIKGEKVRLMVFPVKAEWKKPGGPDFEIKVEGDSASPVAKTINPDDPFSLGTAAEDTKKPSTEGLEEYF